jgi:uncharacterized protein YneF (UPF0154 family)
MLGIFCAFMAGIIIGLMIPRKHIEKHMSYYVAFSDKLIRKIFYK